MRIVAVVVALLSLSIPLYAQQAPTFVSPGAEAGERFREAIDAARAREEAERQARERERIANEYLDLAKRKLALQEQQASDDDTAPSPPTSRTTGTVTEASRVAAAAASPDDDPLSLILVDRTQLTTLLRYLSAAGLERDQLQEVLTILLDDEP